MGTSITIRAFQLFVTKHESGKIDVLKLGQVFCYFDFSKVVALSSPCLLTLHIFYLLTCLILVIQEKKSDKDNKVEPKINAEKKSKQKDASASKSCAKVYHCTSPIPEKLH